MTLTVQSVSAEGMAMRLDGYGRLGETLADKARGRGCEVRVLGFVHYNARKKTLDRFDLVGIGEAWDSDEHCRRREVRIGRNPWMYGIACELVSGDSPSDLLPPYNLLHYGSAGPYFPKK